MNFHSCFQFSPLQITSVESFSNANVQTNSIKSELAFHQELFNFFTIPGRGAVSKWDKEPKYPTISFLSSTFCSVLKYNLARWFKSEDFFKTVSVQIRHCLVLFSNLTQPAESRRFRGIEDDWKEVNWPGEKLFKSDDSSHQDVSHHPWYIQHPSQRLYVYRKPSHPTPPILIVLIIQIGVNQRTTVLPEQISLFRLSPGKSSHAYSLVLERWYHQPKSHRTTWMPYHVKESESLLSFYCTLQTCNCTRGSAIDWRLIRPSARCKNTGAPKLGQLIICI